MRYSSATMTLAPWLAAIRAARTPPEPPPMTKRSTSNSAMAAPMFFLLLYSLSPFLRGEGWGEGLPPRIRLAESPPHPALRADLSPQAGRGEKRPGSKTRFALLPGHDDVATSLHLSLFRRRGRPRLDQGVVVDGFAFRLLIRQLALGRD